MSNSFGFAVGQARTLDRKVRRVDVAVGTLVVTGNDERPVVILAGDGADFADEASLNLHSPTGAKVAVSYFDDPEPKAPKADDPRSVKELRADAKEAGITGYSDMNKTELIGALDGC